MVNSNSSRSIIHKSAHTVCNYAEIQLTPAQIHTTTYLSHVYNFDRSISASEVEFLPFISSGLEFD